MYSNNDQTLLGDAVLLLIMASFFLMALTFWLRVRITGEAALLAPRPIILGLILSAFTGYFPRLVSVDPGLLMLLHVALAALAWGYALYSLVDLLAARRQTPMERDEGEDLKLEP